MADRRRFVGVLVAMMGAASCGGNALQEAEAEVGTTSQALESPNGTSLNGTSLNGTSLNGTSLNGTSLNGVSLNGTSLNGTSLNGVSLNGTVFSGTRADGHPIKGAAFVNTTFSGHLSDGTPMSLRIDAMTKGESPNADLSFYEVTYSTTAGRKPLCGYYPATTTPILAIPVSGVWSYEQGVAGGGSFTPSATSFTFGCRHAAIAECVELGYKPWKTKSGVLLQDHHTACTRMLRADYCGDGRPWTVTGTPINIYDDLKIQRDTMAWVVDAEWGPAGARCIGASERTRWSLLGGSQPECFPRLVSRTCGKASHFDHGTLVMDEYLHDLP
jgi:ADYC domain/Pentapeptide repeats (8 copies)